MLKYRFGWILGLMVNPHFKVLGGLSFPEKTIDVFNS
ncbi:hypothetical protein NC651_037845 [Populus alba x Populus x berolinensis]|nr:hypothetical protein NC651_037845 [Populus alba x Populus x berolinensis]